MKLEIFDLNRPNSSPAWTGEADAIPRQGDHVTIGGESDGISGYAKVIFWQFRMDGSLDVKVRIR